MTNGKDSFGTDSLNKKKTVDITIAEEDYIRQLYPKGQNK
jgi:hypothetical protein